MGQGTPPPGKLLEEQTEEQELLHGPSIFPSPGGPVGAPESMQRKRVVFRALDQAGAHLLDYHTHARELEKGQR